MSARTIALLVAVVCAACGGPTEYRVEEQLSFEGVDAPASVAAPGPLLVSLRIMTGACHEKVRVLTTVSGGIISLEGRADFVTSGRSAVCVDIGLRKDTTIAIPNLTAGSFTVRGVQPPGGTPIDVAVTVTP